MHGDDVASAGVEVSTQIVSKATEIIMDMSTDARVAEVVERRDKGHAQPSAEAPNQDKAVSSQKMKL